MNLKELIRILNKYKKDYGDAEVRVILNHESDLSLIPVSHVAYTYTNDSDRTHIRTNDMTIEKSDEFNKPIVVIYNKEIMNDTRNS